MESPSMESSRAPSPSAESRSAVPLPSQTSAPSVDDLADIAWWDTGRVGFGFTGFEPEPVPAVPEGYRQLRVGTLDGRVTAIRTLPQEWSRSYASGPVNGNVLLLSDDGVTSTVSTIEAATGAEETLFESELIIPAAALSPAGDEVWYVKLERETGADMGLWRRHGDRDEEEQLLPGPLGEPFEPTRTSESGVTIWQLHFSPDGRYLAVQWCFGQVRCTTTLLDVATREARASAELGWPFGFTDSQLVVKGAGGTEHVAALDLVSFDQSRWQTHFEGGMPVKVEDAWVLVGAQGAGAPTQVLPLLRGARPEVLPGDGDVSFTTFHLAFDAGVVLPPGWAIRWPEPAVGTWPAALMPGLAATTTLEAPRIGEVFAQGELINLGSGDRIELPLFVPEVAATGCEIAGPLKTPEGRPAGPSRSELRDGVRYVQWSRGADEVTLAVGTPVIGTPDHFPDEPETEVRGHPARLVVGREEARGGAALIWQEGDCTYTAWLAPGTTLDAAIEYASRY